MKTNKSKDCAANNCQLLRQHSLMLMVANIIVLGFPHLGHAADLGDPFVLDSGVQTITGQDTAGTTWIGLDSPDVTLNIVGGGSLTVSTGRSFYLGINESSYNNETNVSGSGISSKALLSVADDIDIGVKGSQNTLTVGPWGNIVANRLVLGVDPPSEDNSASLSGPMSLAKLSGDLVVGYEGKKNNLVIRSSAKAYAGGHIYVGAFPGSEQNNITLSKLGRLYSDQEMLLGFGHGNNSLIIKDGGQLNNRSTFIGYTVGGAAGANTVKVEGYGSIWRTNDTFYMGFNSSDNTMLITHGGRVSVKNDFIISPTSGSIDNRVTLGRNGVLAATKVDNIAGILETDPGAIGLIQGNYSQRLAGAYRVHIDSRSLSDFLCEATTLGQPRPEEWP